MKDNYPKLLVLFQFTLWGLIMLFSKGFFGSFLSMTIFILGSWLGIWALLHNRVGNFNVQPKMKEGAELITSGIYAYIRHPMYLSVILMNFAFVVCHITFFQITLFLALIIVLFLKAKREESLWLEENLKYAEYKRSTKLFLPFLL